MACAATTATPSAIAGTSLQPWDKAAAGWNVHAALIHDWLHDATQAMLADAQIGLGDRVLDIAAGAGDQTLEIARRVGKDGWVLATDVSPGILALAQKNAEAAGLWQVSTKVADAQLLAQSLDLTAADFDAAVCRLGLMFCRSPRAALRGIRVALRPLGRLSVLVFGRPQNNPCLTITLATARKHAGLGDDSGLLMQTAHALYPGSLMSLGKPGLLEELLKTAGFVDVAMRYVSAPFHATSAAHYVEFLRASASPLIEILAPLSSAAKQAAWNDMGEQLKVFTGPSDWVGPNELLQCVAAAPG